MRQHSFAKNLNVSFRIRIYVQNLEFAFERPSTVVHTFQHHLLPIWHVSIHLILCSVYQRKIQQWKFFILLFSKFQVFHRCNHISKIFSNRGSVSFFILMRNFCSLLNSKSTSSNETPNSLPFPWEWIRKKAICDLWVWRKNDERNMANSPAFCLLATMPHLLGSLGLF